MRKHHEERHTRDPSYKHVVDICAWCWAASRGQFRGRFIPLVCCGDLISYKLTYAWIKCIESQCSYHFQVCAIYWNCHHSHERLPQVQSKLVDVVEPVPVDNICLVSKLKSSSVAFYSTERLMFCFCSMLSSSCWVSLCWSIGSEMPRVQDSRRLNYVQETSVMPFKTELSSTLSNPTGSFVPFVWTFCRNVDRVFTFEKSKL